MLCQMCKKRTATVHLTDLLKDEKRERHLCEECAAAEGVAVKQHVSLTDVLNSFLTSQSSVQAMAHLKCPQCGMTFMEFRNGGLLGCPHDYDAFEQPLEALIARAQDGHGHHTGKSPGQVVEVDPVRQERQRIQRELREAVENENYERAAELRDRLEELKSP